MPAPGASSSESATESTRHKAVARVRATGTHQGEFLGMPATGKAIRTQAIQIFRFADGKIVESWAARDDLGTLKQLGHLPAPGKR